MKQNKFLFSLLILLLLSSMILITNFYFKSEAMEKELDKYLRLVNNLNLERDFEIYKALKENNVIKIKKNLDLNL